MRYDVTSQMSEVGAGAAISGLSVWTEPWLFGLDPSLLSPARLSPFFPSTLLFPPLFPSPVAPFLPLSPFPSPPHSSSFPFYFFSLPFTSFFVYNPFPSKYFFLSLSPSTASLLLSYSTLFAFIIEAILPELHI